MTPDFSKQLDLKNQTYKMIRGIDFYKHILDFAQTFDNVTFTDENIESIDEGSNLAVVKTN